MNGCSSFGCLAVPKKRRPSRDEQIFGVNEQILRHGLSDQQAERRVTSRQHGRGHGTLVSHLTGVGCISEENTSEEATSYRNHCAADSNIGTCTIYMP
jgi:hypothetical protein